MSPLTLAALTALSASLVEQQARLATLLKLVPAPALHVDARAAPPPPQLRLLGTLVSRTTTFSLASVVVDGRTVTIGPGTTVDRWTLVDVGPTCLTWEGPARVTTCVAPGEASPVRAAVAATPATTVELERARLDGYAHAVMASTRGVPVFEHGRLAGLRLAFGADSPLAQAGLKPGDVLTHLEGRPLDPDVALDLWRRAQTLSTARGTVLRGGVPVEVIVKLR